MPVICSFTAHLSGFLMLWGSLIPPTNTYILCFVCDPNDPPLHWSSSSHLSSSYFVLQSHRFLPEWEEWSGTLGYQNNDLDWTAEKRQDGSNKHWKWLPVQKWLWGAMCIFLQIELEEPTGRQLGETVELKSRTVRVRQQPEKQVRTG